MGGDLFKQITLTLNPWFQSTPPYGRRLLAYLNWIFPLSISIHASVWEATLKYLSLADLFLSNFNPRLRMGGDKNSFRLIRYCGDFNPRLRMGGDLKCQNLIFRYILFQSTPPYGRRHGKPVRIHHHILIFQSTPPYGRRPAIARFIGYNRYSISIHASVWEATYSIWRFWGWSKYFNPRLRMGGD